MGDTVVYPSMFIVYEDSPIKTDESLSFPGRAISRANDLMSHGRVSSRFAETGNEKFENDDVSTFRSDNRTASIRESVPRVTRQVRKRRR